METIKEYLVLSSQGTDILTKLVNEHIAKGWQPFGSSAIAISTSTDLKQQIVTLIYLSQAMIK